MTIYFGVPMQQEAVPATSKYWDNKQITLTENTKKTIRDKAYSLDGEAMFAQYHLEGKEAAKALESNGVSPEQLASNPNTYSFIAYSSIDALEANASKEARVEAIQGLIKLGFTNIYESNTRNFITPPADEEAAPPEPPPAQPPQEEEPRYQYAPKRQQQSYEPPPEQYYESPRQQAVSPRASLAGAARFIPNAVRQALPMRGPNNMTPARITPNPGAAVRPNPRLAPQQTAYVRPGKDYAGQQQREPKSQVQRPLLNRDMAARLGGRVTKVVNPSASKNAARSRFGLKVKR